jgi:23S rRNA (cytosine1962-C5)-methyltransferase
MPDLHLHLKKGRDKSVREGHPWLFSGAIAQVEGDTSSPVAAVYAAGGELLGFGFYSPNSQIRVRLLGRRAETVDRAFFADRLAQAEGLRRGLLPPGTTGYRVLNAEGDGVPGWTVDRFGDVLVSQITSAGLEGLREAAYGALRERFPEAAIVQVNQLPTRRQEGLSRQDEVIHAPDGDLPEAVPFTECGFHLTAEPLGGQKTGYYCDQRENRRLVERLAAGETVLDLFAHSGAFGLYALRGGAAAVTHVESSVRVIERGKVHYRANSLPEERVEWVQGDVFADLREREDRYGLVICDPPPLVRHREHVNKGARAYKDLNRLALAKVQPGGLFLTFSCSGAVDTRLFRQILHSAAAEAGVRVALLQPLAAAPDHPVDLQHPQGEYLKGWLCRVQGAL